MFCGDPSIVGALVDQDWYLWSSVGSHEFGGIVCFASLDASEIAGEGLASPVALSWIGDGGESGYRLVQSWVLEVERESAMATHAVAGDTSSCCVYSE